MLGYYNLTATTVNGVSFSDMGFEETTEYQDVNSTDPVDLSVGMYNVIFANDEGTGTESTWSIAETYNEGIYYTLRFYYDLSGDQIALEVTHSATDQGAPVYTELDDPRHVHTADARTDTGPHCIRLHECTDQ